MKPVKLNLKNCQNIGSENAAEKTPSDALVINTSEYQQVLSKALNYIFDKNAIVTIGIKECVVAGAPDSYIYYRV